MFLLTALSAALVWAVFHGGGTDQSAWAFSMLLIAVAAIVYWLRTPKWKQAPPVRGLLWWALLLLPVYGLLQLAPLPIPILGILSPARARLAEACGIIGAAPNTAPLSVAPAATLEEVLRLTTYAIAVLLVRELSWRWSDRAWLPVLPLVAAGALQGALGLMQFYSGEEAAHGSYVNRNHYAGLLEMTLPFAMLYPAALLNRSRAPWRESTKSAWGACVGAGAALLILLGLLHSMSRMGFVAGAVAALICGSWLIASGMQTRRPRVPRLRGVVLRLAVLGFVLAGGALFLFLAPDALVARFGDLSRPGRIAEADRRPLWRESLPLIAAYAPFGCGLGAYESAFLAHKVSCPLCTDDFAHNDYLQYLAELGVAGFFLAASAMTSVLAHAVQAAAKHCDFAGRSLAMATFASFVAILLHSFVDFNLYIPANGLLVAWIAGLACGAMFSSHPTSSRKVVAISAVTVK